MEQQPNNLLPKLPAVMQENLEILKSDKFKKQLRKVFEIRNNPAAIAKAIVFTIGVATTFVGMAGMLGGYVRGYNRFLRRDKKLPRFHYLPLIIKVAMGVGIIVAWIIVLMALNLWNALSEQFGYQSQGIIAFFGINLVLSIIVFGFFRRWQVGINNMMIDIDKHASARYATEEDMEEYLNKEGLYIGGKYATSDKGHIFVAGGARGGKGKCFIIPNVLNLMKYKGSMVVLDIKGEITSICAEALRKLGKKVVILNPWNLLLENIKSKNTYNPLDILSDRTSPHLIDDVAIIAEMLVPISAATDHNAFFTDSARNLISGLLLHLVTTDKVEQPSLDILYEWCRYYGEQWDELLADMAVSSDPVNGEAVRNAANECLKMMESPETFASIISNALQSTNFLKSKALQESLVSQFDPYTLSEGDTVVFVILPADKLKTAANWLRLVTTTLLRAVVRKPKNRVTFMIDEAANLGYMSEIEIALAAYAGYEITMALIYQDLPQVHSTYGQKWESIIANCSTRLFMSVKDNFTCDYVSHAMGQTTRTVYSKSWFGIVSDAEHVQRALATPEEVKRMSGKEIILFTGENPVTTVDKLAYYDMPELKSKDGKTNLYAPNPYIKDSK